MGVPPPSTSYKPGHSPVFYVAIVGAIGCGMLFLFAILAAILFPVFAQAREKARTASCLGNVKQQATALSMYAQDYDETLPEPDAWMDRLATYARTERIFHCPSVSRLGQGPCGYAYNRGISGTSVASVEDPKKTIAFYDSVDLGRSVSDKLTSLPQPGRHVAVGGKGNAVSYVDGHAKCAVD